MNEDRNAAWMIYGACGYRGRMIAALAKERELKPILTRRDQAKLAGVAGRLGLETC